MTEPEVDVFEQQGALVVLAKLPGVWEEEIQVPLDGDVLTIDTGSGRHDRPRYHREILLPFPAATESVQRAFRNGVLDIELERDCASSDVGRKQT